MNPKTGAAGFFALRFAAAGWACFGLAFVALQPSARADGLVSVRQALSAEHRAELVRESADLANARPEVRARVRDVRGVRPEVYGRARNPKPEAQRELLALGPDARLAMLEALLLDASQTDLATADRHALVVGMMSALGKLADARNQPYLRALSQASTPSAREAALEALGHACEERDVATLAAEASSAVGGRGALAGLGACRRSSSARALSAALRTAGPAAVDRVALLDAMGRLGSSWAWAALEKKTARSGSPEKAAQVAALGLEIRETLAGAIVDRFDADATLREPALRAAALRALRSFELPSLGASIAKRAAEHRARGDRARADALDDVARELAALRGR